MNLELTPSTDGTSTKLAVVVRGLGSGLLVQDVAALVAAEVPNADIALATYDTTLLSNAPADREAYELALEIGRKVEERKKRGGSYSSIILIGHSIGALLVRAAYLMAAGHRFTTQNQLAPAAWARPSPAIGANHRINEPYVERLVLLSGLNNGWTTPEAEQLGRFRRIKSLIVTLLITATSFLDKARLMRSVMRGSPFVVDVRLNWLGMIGAASPSLEPETVQLVGETDDLVKQDDIYDFISGKNFKHREVKDTRHYDLGVLKTETVDAIRADLRAKASLTRWFFAWMLPTYRISPNPSGSRKAELTAAILAPWNNIQVLIKKTPQTPANATDVVIIRHGIRDDHLGWVAGLGKAITAHASSSSIVSDTHSYGRFSMLQFMLRGARIRRVYGFMDEYVDLCAKYPLANFHFFGHSYGTYIGSKALKEYRSCRFKHVVLANAVIASDFPWQEILQQRQAAKVLNLRGSRDYVVAWFPGAFQAWREMWGRKAARSSDLLGGAGFKGSYSNNVEDGGISGAHGAGVQEAHFPKVVNFIVSGSNEFPNEPRPNWLIGLIGRFPFIAWIVLLWAGVEIALAVGFPWALLVPVALLSILHFV
jgi:pimeloyl-ACP methyl ester carboxylesterase